MNKNEIEKEKDITFDEFKSWMNGLVYGKGKDVPDARDWKLIKQMMERVVPDKVEIQIPAPWPTIPTPPVLPYTEPYTSPNTTPFKWEPTCSIGDSISTYGKLTIGDVSGSDYGGNGQTSDYIDPADFGITNQSCLPQGSLLPCPVVAVGNTEESTTPALDKARVLLKKFKDAPSEPKSSYNHTWDTSKYSIQVATGDDLENIAKIMGIEK